MRVRWNQLGGQTGIALTLLGLFLIFLGWNGAASYDRVPSQFPYLISGGIAGLALVIVGAALMIVQSLRQDRAALVDAIFALQERAGAGASATNAGPGDVVVGGSSYHRPDCRLLEGRGQLPRQTVERARERGLDACRVCSPDDLEPEPDAGPPARARRRVRS